MSGEINLITCSLALALEYMIFSRKLSSTTITNGHAVKHICTITSKSVSASSEFEILILRSKFCVAAWEGKLKAYIDEMEPLCLLQFCLANTENCKIITSHYGSHKYH